MILHHTIPLKTVYKHMKLHNLQEAEAALQPFIPSVAQVTGRDITLTRMWPMMEVIGNPQQKLKIIHIAGTSGKTSTAYYLGAQLQATDKKIGLHVSPHIDKVTERFQINGAPISDELFCSQLGIFLDIIYEHHLQPTYFELHIAFAYWFFVRQAVDYAVMETGMGGLHDGTNVARNPDKICVITDIGIDHTKYLGTTIPEIAAQKAGIIHPQNLVYMYTQGLEVMEVVAARCQSEGASLSTTNEDVERRHWTQPFEASFVLYQQRNWLLAHFVLVGVQKRDGFPMPTAERLAQTQLIQVPGRMDLRSIGDKLLVMDGAHNEQKMTAFMQSFQARFPGQKADLMISLKQEKDYKVVIDSLLPIAHSVITTSFETSQELPVVSMDPEILADYCRQKGIEQVTVQPDHHKAYELLLSSPLKLLVITGSFYLLYQVREREHLV
jgi:dihydrofolate synthase/folylpolyglutamate synthase